jgi:hypothetical protein
MKIILLDFKVFTFLILFGFLSVQGFAQSTGDYRSVATGNWTALASWQYYNGTSWVTPSGTSPQGYPGQFAGTGTVTVRNTNTITLTTSITNSFTKLIIGEGVSGVFVVGADIASFNTLDIIINTGGIMSFVGQYFIKLPANSGIKINAPGKIDASGNGDCTNNTAIYLGGVKFGVCKGAGNAEYTFAEINNFGGTLFSAPSSNSPLCLGTSINLVGGYFGPTPTSISYSWSIKAPDDSTTTNSNKDFSITAEQTGVYQATLTCNAYSDTRLYSNSETISITVNSLPATPTVIAGSSTTFCNGGSVTLTSSAGTSYLWSTGATTQSISATTAGNYTVKVTNANGCQSTSSAPTAVTVNSAPSIATQPLSQLDCEGSLVNFKVIASGTNLSYVWKYKRPTDSAFVTLTGTETNTTYPNTPIYNEISLANVGSAQYPNGTQFQVVVSNGTCSFTSNVVVLSVNEILAINSPALTPTQSVNDVKLCSGSNYSYTAVVSNPSNGPVSYQWKSQFPSGSWNNVVDGLHFSGATTATLNIINGTPAQSGKYRVDVVYNRTGGNCSVSSFSKVRSLTFFPQIAIPQVTISQPDCTINTGSITVAVQNTTDTYSFDNGLNYQSSNTKSGLAAGGYAIFIKNSSGCISIVVNSTIIAAPLAAIWDAITQSWTNGPPTSTQAVFFNGPYTLSANMEACSCQVNTGAVKVNSGITMKITNAVTVAGGSLTFDDKASLVQINNVSNSGNIMYNRVTNPISNFDYTYWSSPVTGQKLIDFSPNTLGDKFLSFNSFSNSWNFEDAYNNLMGKGVGYIIRGPQTKSGQPPSTQLYRFTGVPNNGLVSLPIGAAGNSVLMGNPYPSALDADKFLDANASLIEGTIYFWTHNTSLRLASSLAAGTAGSGSYAYTSDDYAAYNRTGGVATYAAPSASNPSPSSPIVSSNAPTVNIGAGQSFFGTSLASGTVQFTNDMRVGFTGLASNSNAQFFKTTSTKKTVAKVDKSRIWIDLTNEEGAFKETLLGYITGATNAFETAFDGETFDANAYIDFYSINDNKKLAIQGRAFPFDDSEVIPLGYKANIGGQFSINIRDRDGLFTSQKVYLEDKLLGTVFDLNQGTYKFSTEVGVFNERFAIRYTNKTLGVDIVDPVAKGVYISTRNKVITVQVDTETIAAAYVYDLAGKQLFGKKAVDSNQMTISNLNASNVVLIVKVVLNNGLVVTQKIVY